MEESKKRTIVIASVLKPVDDTRMYEKFAQSLVARCAVHIIGQKGSGHPVGGVTFHALFDFKRVSFKRLIAGWKVFFKIQSVKPHIVIITTPELLWVGVVQKIFFRREFYYDILENYYWNIIDGKSFPIVIRSIVGSLVRLTEVFASPFVDKFFLAEKRYASELSFASPNVVLQNKLPKKIAGRYDIKHPKSVTDFLFTGTLSKTTGVFDAIQIVTELHEREPSIRLTIVGYCHLANERKRLFRETRDKSFITIVGGDQLVDHGEILAHIAKSDFGIIVYPPNLGTFTSIPTKLFEYLALRLPIIARHNPETHQLIEQYDAGIVLPARVDYDNLLASLQKARLSCKVSDEIYWENEADSLISSFS